MFLGKPPIPRRGKGGFPVFINSFVLSLCLAVFAVFAARPASAYTVSAGAVVYEIYGIAGAYEVVHGQFISAGWKLNSNTTFAFIYEYGLAHGGIGAEFSDYGAVLDRDLRKGVGMGIRISQATVWVGGNMVFREPIFGLHGRVAIMQLKTASLGIMAGCIFAPDTPNGPEVSPRIALVGMR